jgi:hypothetical protein
MVEDSMAAGDEPRLVVTYTEVLLAGKSAEVRHDIRGLATSARPSVLVDGGTLDDYNAATLAELLASTIRYDIADAQEVASGIRQLRHDVRGRATKSAQLLYDSGFSCPQGLTLEEAQTLTLAQLSTCTLESLAAPIILAGASAQVRYDVQSRATQNRALGFNVAALASVARNIRFDVVAPTEPELFPQVPESVFWSEPTDTLSHHLPVGAFTGLQANDIILCVTAVDGAPTVTLPSGYTSLLDVQSGGTNFKTLIYWKRATGSEGDTTLTTNVAEKSVTRIFRITGAHTTTALEAAVPVLASSINPDPPSYAPTWAQDDTLWFAVAGVANGSTTVSGFPTDFVGGTAETSGGSSDGVTLGTARRELNEAGLNPGPFALSTSRSYVATTITVRPVPDELVADATRAIRYNVAGRATKTGQARHDIRGMAASSRIIRYDIAQPTLQVIKSAQVLYAVLTSPTATREIRYHTSTLAGKSAPIHYAIGGPAIDPALLSTPYRLTEAEAEIAMLQGAMGQIEWRYRLFRSNNLSEKLSELRTVEEASFSLDNFRDHTWELSLPMDVATDLDIWGDWVRLEVEMRASAGGAGAGGSYTVVRPFGLYFFDERGGQDAPERRQWELGGKSAEARLMGSTAELGYSISAGEGILENVRQILLDQGVPPSMIVFPPTSEDVAMGTTTHFDPFQSGTDTRWLRIANTILAAGGFLALFADNEGRLNTRKISTSNRIEPSHTYGTTQESDRMIASESITYVYDDENFANRVVVYSGDPSEAASFGVAENHDPNSRVSFERLGYWVQKSPIELPSLVSPAEAQEVARQALRVASGMNLRLNFDTVFDTRIRPRQAYGLEVFDDAGEAIWTGDTWPVMSVSADLNLSPMHHEVQIGVML